MSTRNRCATLAALAVAALAPAGLAAQTDPIVTDRPGLLFAATTVGDGVWQVEAGAPLVRDRHDGGESRAAGLALALRYGVGERWELRLGTAVSRVDPGLAGAAATTGVGDLELGAKVALRNGAGGGPAIALVFSATLPTGADELSAGDPFATLLGVASQPLAHGWSAAAMLGGRGGELAGERFFDAFAAGLLGRALPWEGWSGFVEAGWTELDAGPGVGLAGAGVSYLVNADVQLDASVGRGVNDAAPDWRFEVGAAVRF